MAGNVGGAITLTLAMNPLDAFTVDDLVELSAALRELGAGTSSMEEVAQRIVRYLYVNLVDATGRSACPLVRFYKTHRFDGLDDELQAVAVETADGPLDGDTRCLVLLATAGVEPGWNDRRSSKYDAAVPLTPGAVNRRGPNVAGLIDALGLDLDFVMRPTPREALERHHQEYRVMHVADVSADNPFSSQRRFIDHYRIRSVLAIGGMLPSGDMFAVGLFSTVTIDDRTADLLRSLSLSVKAAIVRQTFKVFAANT
jgi:hypothetical protein